MALPASSPAALPQPPAPSANNPEFFRHDRALLTHLSTIHPLALRPILHTGNATIHHW